MTSKWFDLKPQAIELRKSGMSLRDVEKALNIPKSTLSGWFRNIKLNPKIQFKLTEKRLSSLEKARKQAVMWHNQQREKRQKEAEGKAISTLNNIDVSNSAIQELALAMLYLGEGGKSSQGTVMGSSDPEILRFLIRCLIDIFGVKPDKIKCSLHLRIDQNPIKLRGYWSRQLGISVENFTSSSIDKRSAGHATYPGYNGVCVVRCGNIAIQRRLVYLSKRFCNIISGTGG